MAAKAAGVVGYLSAWLRAESTVIARLDAMRFTIRDILCLTAIAGVACVAGIVIWRADSGEEMAGVFWLFAGRVLFPRIAPLFKNTVGRYRWTPIREIAAPMD
jgi:hypothetical protein